MSVQIPHPALPFRYSQGKLAVTEQDSPEDVANCVFAVCATEPGQFLDLPEFGLADLTFSQQPLQKNAILAAINKWEPRALVTAQTFPSAIDEAIANANLEVEE